MSNRLIYLDNNSTTPTDSRIVEVMVPFLTTDFANASSSHFGGMTINKQINNARIQIADLLGGTPDDIIFTSGATESVNLALKGFALANKNKGNHIITVKTEHKAVLDTCKYLESIGFEVSYLSVKSDGQINLQDLKNEIRHDTILVSMMFVNNETGVLHPIEKIASITHDAGALFFSDATQAVGKIPFDVNKLGIDLLAFSGHKFYAPKGVGGLYVNGLKKNKIRLEAILHGGGHQNGLRSGTLNVPGIMALGKATEIAKEEMTIDAERISTLRDVLENNMLKFPNSFVNGSTENRIYNVSNICFKGIDANVMIGKLKNIAVSNGSACSSAMIEPSHVLKAIGLSDDDAMASIRFSLGKYNTEEDIHLALNIFQDFFTQLSLKYA